MSTETTNRRGAEWISDARWLYEFHDKRSTSAQSRAVAVMTFAGALLALVPHLVTADSGQADLAKILFVATAVLAVVVIGLAIANLMPKTVNVIETNRCATIGRRT